MEFPSQVCLISTGQCGEQFEWYSAVSSYNTTKPHHSICLNLTFFAVCGMSCINAPLEVRVSPPVLGSHFTKQGHKILHQAHPCPHTACTAILCQPGITHQKISGLSPLCGDEAIPLVFCQVNLCTKLFRILKLLDISVLQSVPNCGCRSWSRNGHLHTYTHVN